MFPLHDLYWTETNDDSIQANAPDSSPFPIWEEEIVSHPCVRYTQSMYIANPGDWIWEQKWTNIRLRYSNTEKKKIYKTAPLHDHERSSN